MGLLRATGTLVSRHDSDMRRLCWINISLTRPLMPLYADDAFCFMIILPALSRTHHPWRAYTTAYIHLSIINGLPHPIVALTKLNISAR